MAANYITDDIEELKRKVKLFGEHHKVAMREKTKSFIMLRSLISFLRSSDHQINKQTG